jgi:hypothetical protein
MNSRDIQNLSEAYLGIYSEDFKELDPYKTELVQGRHSQLASEILKNRDEVKRLSKKPFARHRPGIKQKIIDLVSQSKRKHKLAQNASDALIRSSVGRSAKIQKKIEDLKTQLPKNKIVPFHREELEYLISYLLDEGYAYDLSSAENIAIHMSEEWAYEILNEGSLADMLKAHNDEIGASIRRDKESAERIRSLINSMPQDIPKTSRPSASTGPKRTRQEIISDIKRKLDDAEEVIRRQEKTK